MLQEEKGTPVTPCYNNERKWSFLNWSWICKMYSPQCVSPNPFKMGSIINNFISFNSPWNRRRMGARQIWVEKDEMFLKRKRKKLLLSSFSEGIANNRGELKTQDAKSSPAMNSPAWAAPAATRPWHQAHLFPSVLCGCVRVCVFLSPTFFHSGEMLPLGKH